MFYKTYFISTLLRFFSWIWLIFLYISHIISPVWHLYSLETIEIWLRKTYWKRHFQIYSWNKADILFFSSFLKIITFIWILIIKNIKSMHFFFILLYTVIYLTSKVYRNLWQEIAWFILFRKATEFQFKYN